MSQDAIDLYIAQTRQQMQAQGREPAGIRRFVDVDRIGDRVLSTLLLGSPWVCTCALQQGTPWDLVVHVPAEEREDAEPTVEIELTQATVRALVPRLQEWLQEQERMNKQPALYLTVDTK